jgi:putative membrane protein
MTTQRLQQLQSLAITVDRRALALIGVWLLAMIAFPISYWIWGSEVIPLGITLAAIVQSLAVFGCLALALGTGKALQLTAIIFVLTWLAEAIGSKTGIPFGAYSYTDVLQPQVFNVPLLVPLAWFMMLPPSWAIAQTIVGKKQNTLAYALQFSAVSALAMTAWDLFLDPQMVNWNFWVWQYPSGYFGIPFVNFFGWLLVSFIVSWVANPPQLPRLPLAIIYACVWFLQSIGLAAFWGMPAPALFGSLGMAAMMFWAYRRAKGARWT